MWTYNYSDELYHHGIKGMKWGVQNGPPYPLSASAHSVSEKKAGWRKSLDKSSESSDTRDKRSGKFALSDKQKTALKVGAVVAGAALASYGTYRLYKSGKLDSFIERGKTKSKELLTGTLDDDISRQKIEIQNGFGKFKKLANKETIDDVISKVNHTGEGNNCFNVVTATTARLCGIDVHAKGDSQGGKGMLFEDVCKVFKLKSTDIKTMYDPTVDKLSKYIGNKYKEGDVGAIGLSWNDAYKQLRYRYSNGNISMSEPAGHTLNWIIENGKVVFADGQGRTLDQRTRNRLQMFLDSGKDVSIARFANRISGINPDTDIDLELFKKMVE